MLVSEGWLVIRRRRNEQRSLKNRSPEEKLSQNLKKYFTVPLYRIERDVDFKSQVYWISLKV